MSETSELPNVQGKVERQLDPSFTKGMLVNKSQLIDALSAHYDGNKRAAQHALESVVDTIMREVARGEKVAITGFGAFEKAVRPSRMVRNPATGQRVRAKKTAVPKFRAGSQLKEVVSGARKLPKLTVTRAATTAGKAATTAKKTATKATAKKAPAKKTAAKKAPAKAAAKKTTVKKAPAKKAPAKVAAKKTTAKKAPAKKAPAKVAAKKTAAKKAPAKKTTAKKAPAKKTAAKKAPAKKTAAKKAPAKKAAAKRTAKKS